MRTSQNSPNAQGTANATTNNGNTARRKVRCAIYTRKSSEEGLEQEFNSLDAQREACEAYIASQKHEGWVLLKDHYDDGGLSGGNMDRPALQNLLAAIDDGLLDQIVVYKVDRLTRSLPDFSRLIERLDKAKASFVSVTQSFNTATSMGRLTLNVLLSFAQFEREVTAERIRDKIAASKKKGMWMGGPVPLGYNAKDRALIAREDEATIVRQIYDLYLEQGTVRETKAECDRIGLRSKLWTSKTGRVRGGLPLSRGHLYRILTNPIYVGMVHHKGATYDGLHDGIIDPDIWQRVQDQLTIGETRRANNTKLTVESETLAPANAEVADETDSSIAVLLDNPSVDALALPVPSPAKPKRRYGTEPSPLVGKVFDEKGDRLTPSHANKKGRRYRYYISNRLIARSGERDQCDQDEHNREVDGNLRSENGRDVEGRSAGPANASNNESEVAAPIGGWRLPADTLERAVADAFTGWLREPTLPSRFIVDGSADEQQHIQQRLGSLLHGVEGIENAIADIASLIHRVDLSSGELTILLDTKAFAKALDIDASRIELEAIAIKASFHHRKRGVETKLLLGHSTPQIDTMLIRNVAQARSWYGALKSGSSLATIAQTSGTTVHMINRILPLAFLSPSIVEAICTGRQPPELTSRKLRDITIPMDWAKQEKLFELS